MRSWILMVSGIILLLLGGCGGPAGGYTLRAKVMTGEMSYMAFVPSDAPELLNEGISGVNVSVFRDPQSLGRELSGSSRSTGDGWTTIRISGFGAGWLDEVWEFQAIRGGYETVTDTLRLPRKRDEMVLTIYLRPGTSIAPTDHWQETERDFERYR